MQKIKIRKGVKLALTYRQKQTEKAKRVQESYPFSDMKVGDSFTANVKMHKLYNACRRWKQNKISRTALKFTVRKVTDTRTSIWRLK